MRVIEVEQLTKSQQDDLYRLYQNEWWTADRRHDEVLRAVERSDEIVGLVDPDTERLIAFARILTDYTYKALIFDVIVDQSHRGENLGRELMDRILSHPRLAGVDHFELYCLGELTSFYEQWGFTDELGDLRLMRHERGGEP